MAVDDNLTKQVARLLRRRPGWSIQTMPTPGAPLTWCFGSSGKIEMSVSVQETSIRLHVVETDQDVRVGSASELAAWLQAHKPGAFKDPTSGFVDRLKSGKFFKWE
jgi:hypothetical protein